MTLSVNIYYFSSTLGKGMSKCGFRGAPFLGSSFNVEVTWMFTNLSLCSKNVAAFYDIAFCYKSCCHGHFSGHAQFPFAHLENLNYQGWTKDYSVHFLRIDKIETSLCTASTNQLSIPQLLWVVNCPRPMSGKTNCTGDDYFTVTAGNIFAWKVSTKFGWHI